MCDFKRGMGTALAEFMTKDAPRMPAAARRSAIVRIVERDGFVSVGSISEILGVSEMTVRRDLEALDEKALVERTFGGALRRREAYEAEEPAFDRRRRTNASAKEAIAQRAAALVAPRETLGVDVGSTALAFAHALSGRNDVRVFTNNLRAATVLASHLPVHVPPGTVREGELSIVGGAAVAHLQDFALDSVFLGVSGLSENGLYDYSLEDTEVKRILIAQAERVVVIADSSKFGRRSLARIARLHEVDVLVTDAEPPPHLAGPLEEAGVEILLTTENPE